MIQFRILSILYLYICIAKRNIQRFELVQMARIQAHSTYVIDEYNLNHLTTKLGFFVIDVNTSLFFSLFVVTYDYIFLSSLQ